MYTTQKEANPWQTPPLADTPLGRDPPGQTPPPPADCHCSGRYASYWNAFLFIQNFTILYIFQYFLFCSNVISLCTNVQSFNNYLSITSKCKSEENILKNETKFHLIFKGYLTENTSHFLHSGQWKVSIVRTEILFFSICFLPILDLLLFSILAFLYHFSLHVPCPFPHRYLQQQEKHKKWSCSRSAGDAASLTFQASWHSVLPWWY